MVTPRLVEQDDCKGQFELTAFTQSFRAQGLNRWTTDYGVLGTCSWVCPYTRDAQNGLISY